jgi:hypothetical protein
MSNLNNQRDINQGKNINEKVDQTKNLGSNIQDKNIPKDRNIDQNVGMQDKNLGQGSSNLGQGLGTSVGQGQGLGSSVGQGQGLGSNVGQGMGTDKNINQGVNKDQFQKDQQFNKNQGQNR